MKLQDQFSEFGFYGRYAFDLSDAWQSRRNDATMAWRAARCCIINLEQTVSVEIIDRRPF